MKKRRRSLGRPLLHARARCVITEHLADRRKSPVWSTEAIYLLASTVGVPEAGRATRGPDLRWSASLNRHRIWPDCENEHVKEACASLDIRNANNGPPPHYRILYLELRRRPMSREHARPQPPAGSRRYGGARGRGASPGAGRGHRPPNPAAQGPSWTPRSTPSPSQLPPGPRWRTVA
jgi:hypothetical protein